jgi:hypothetical protein
MKTPPTLGKWQRTLRSKWHVGCIVALFAGSANAALEFGPFELTGFAKEEFSKTGSACLPADCQTFSSQNKQAFWADYTQGGASYGAVDQNTVLFQPWLTAKFDLGKGYKLSGMLSQRWRSRENNPLGSYQVDIPGYVYEKNLALSHEDYGSIRIGNMTTRAWAVADYPYGSNLNLASFWGASGAAYGHLVNGIRYTSRTFDVLEGDLVTEVSYSPGNTGYTAHKPYFLELYAQYHRGDFVMDVMMQDTRNGLPSSWAQTPFFGPTYSSSDDSKIGSSGQSIVMAMARYELTSQIQLSGGIRHNRWSGAYAEIVSGSGNTAQWNSMFNVNWKKPITLSNGTVTYQGFPVTSLDLMAGARYRYGKWVASYSAAYLGKGSSSNPEDRGQNNSALVNTLGLTYDYIKGVQLYGFAGQLHYGQKGLSPVSMPGNAAFYNIDSRVTRDGYWAGVGVVYVW